MPPLHWCHNGRDSVSNHQLHDCLLNRLFRCRSKKTSKLRATGLCVGNSPGTGEFHAQMASYAENVSIWWRHHIWLHWLPNFSTSQSVMGRVYHPHCWPLTYVISVQLQVQEMTFSISIIFSIHMVYLDSGALYLSVTPKTLPIESIKTMSMEDVSAGVLEKNKEYLRSKDKAEKWYDVSRHI